MKEDITRLFDKITPIRSDDEIIANVIGKAENMERNNTKRNKSFKKPLIAVCAAVTALTIGTVGVGAANNWDYAGLLANFFSGRAIENTAEWQNNFDFEKYGMPLDNTIVNDDYTLNFHGIAADRSTAIIVLDVIVNDLNSEVSEFVNLSATATVPLGISSGSYLIEQNENALTLAVYFASDTDFPNDVVSFEFNSLRYELLHEDGTTDETSNRKFYIGETVEIDMGSFNRSTDIKTIKPEHIYNFDKYELTLTEIRITPFRICYELEGDNSKKSAMWIDGTHEKILDEISIILSDGNEMRFRGGAFSGVTEETFVGEKTFYYPINPDDVVSVTIAGVTYDFTNE